MKWITDLIVSIFTLDFSRKESKRDVVEIIEDEAEEDPSTASRTFKIIVAVVFILSIVVGFAGTAVINSGIYDHYIKQRETYKAKPKIEEPKPAPSINERESTMDY